MTEHDSKYYEQKKDSKKIRLGRVLKQFPLALRAVAQVGMDGAKKYTWDGWLETPDCKERYEDALFRHAIPEDGLWDKDSSTLHKAHLAWDALAILEEELKEGTPLKCQSLPSIPKPQVLNLEEVPDLFTSPHAQSQEISEVGDFESNQPPEMYRSRIKIDKKSETIFTGSE